MLEEGFVWGMVILVGFWAVIYVFRSSHWFKSSNYSENEVQKDEMVEPKVIRDPEKYLCQQVKFMVRLKKKMRRFKERKERQKDL